MNDWKAYWCSGENEFADAALKLTRCKRLLIDTETAGWQAGLENEFLSLVQIGDPEKKKIFVFDIFSFSKGDVSKEKSVLGPLAPILSNQKTTLVAHHATYDVRQFERSEIFPAQVIDTKALAREFYLIRKLEPSPESCSLKPLYEFFTGKSAGEWEELRDQDWSVRPLSEKMKRYAENDIVILSHVFEELLKTAAEQGVNPTELPWRDSPYGDSEWLEWIKGEG